MSTQVAFLNQTRTELRTFAGIRFRSVAALWLRHWFAFIRFWKYAIAFLFVEPVVMMIGVGVGVGIGRLVPTVPGTEIPIPNSSPPALSSEAPCSSPWSSAPWVPTTAWRTSSTTPS